MPFHGLSCKQRLARFSAELICQDSLRGGYQLPSYTVSGRKKMSSEERLISVNLVSPAVRDRITYTPGQRSEQTDNFKNSFD